MTQLSLTRKNIVLKDYLSALAMRKPVANDPPGPSEAELVKAKDQAYEDWRNLKVYSGGGSPHEAERRYYAAKTKLDTARSKRS